MVEYRGDAHIEDGGKAVPTSGKVLKMKVREWEHQKLDKHQVGETVKRYFDDWKDVRRNREEQWRNSWAQYWGTPQANMDLRSGNVDVEVGDIGVDWRHRISTGKAFEITESYVSYLMGAFFPSSDFFDMLPETPMSGANVRDFIKQVKSFTKVKMMKGGFKLQMRPFLRQAVVAGTSVMAMPWRYDRKMTFRNRVIPKDGGNRVKKEQVPVVLRNEPEYETVDLFDFYLDPQCNLSTGLISNCIRRMEKTREEIIARIMSKDYNSITVKEARELRGHPRGNTDNVTKRRVQEDYQGLQYESDHKFVGNSFELLEYWGDLTIADTTYFDVVATCTSTGKLLDFRTNPYWAGKPFVVGTPLLVHDSPYGIGIIEAVLSKLHLLYLTQNQRLDNAELAINKMWGIIEDGTVDMDEVYSEPGKKIRMADPGSVFQLGVDKDFSVPIEQEQLMETRIDKTTGLIGTVGMGGSRDAERVTKAEIDAVREAGGTRLNEVHSHIQDSAFYRMINQTYKYLQQFQVTEETVRVPSNNPEVEEPYEFITMTPFELQADFELIPKGADHLADKEQELRSFFDWMNGVTANPELAARTNWDAVAEEFARKFLKEDWQRFVQPAPELPAQDELESEEAVVYQQQGEEPPPVPPTPDEQVVAQMAAINGAEGAGATQQALVDGTLAQTAENQAKLL